MLAALAIGLLIHTALPAEGGPKQIGNIAVGTTLHWSAEQFPAGSRHQSGPFTISVQGETLRPNRFVTPLSGSRPGPGASLVRGLKRAARRPADGGGMGRTIFLSYSGPHGGFICFTSSGWSSAGWPLTPFRSDPWWRPVADSKRLMGRSRRFTAATCVSLASSIMTTASCRMNPIVDHKVVRSPPTPIPSLFEAEMRRREPPLAGSGSNGAAPLCGERRANGAPRALSECCALMTAAAVPCWG